MDRRFFEYDDHRWRLGRFTVPSVTRGGRADRVADGGLCCAGGDVEDMVVVLKLVVRLPR